MTEWSKGVWIIVNMIGAVFILTICIQFSYIGKRMSNVISKQDANREVMLEYRKYNGYDNKLVYAQDIVSLVLEDKEDVGVRILVSGSLYAYWCNNADIEDVLQEGDDAWNLNYNKKRDVYTTTAIQEALDVHKIYKGSVRYGLNGEVLGVSFLRGTVNNDGEFHPD